MMVRLDSSALRETRWYEYGLRFVFGGVITAAAGWIAREFGPTVGGLFLAFPAIFPATATLIEKHEREKKARKGLNGNRRGREAAALEAVGTAMGSLGLVLFAALVWMLLPGHAPGLVLTGATVAWLAASSGIWGIRRKKGRNRN
jgi:Protein of unknown function (DUF3147)